MGYVGREHDIGVLRMHVEQIRSVRTNGTIENGVLDDGVAKALRGGVDDACPHTTAGRAPHVHDGVDPLGS